MLPSFRLIAVTFLCGFLVVFAGLRLAASLNDIHEGLPVMAAHAAPVSIAPVADREARRGLATVPMMYDLRFAVSTVAPTLVRVAPSVLERQMERQAVAPTLVPQQAEAEPTNAPEPPATAVAAIRSNEPAIRLPDFSAIATAEPAAPEGPALAAIDPQGESRTVEPGPAAVPPAAEIPAAAAKAEAIETPAAASEGAAEPLQAEPDTAAAIEAPAHALPESPALTLPESREAAAPPSATAAENGSSSLEAAAAPEAAAIAPAPAAKAKVVRKKRVRTAHRPAPVNNFGTFSTPPSNPFGTQ